MTGSSFGIPKSVAYVARLLSQTQYGRRRSSLERRGLRVMAGNSGTRDPSDKRGTFIAHPLPELKRQRTPSDGTMLIPTFPPIRAPWPSVFELQPDWIDNMDNIGFLEASGTDSHNVGELTESQMVLWNFNMRRLS